MKNNVENNQLLLPNGKIITFNAEQFEGINKIKHWLKDKQNINQNIFTLAGYAGTGKSTIVKKILDNYRGGVVVSAPTHKAKKVVMKTTGEDGQTLHSLLGLRPNVNLDEFNPNDPTFHPIAIPKISDYNLVIIDEASMINQDLYNLITDKIKNTGTKVLFMGDPAQIPPVGEKESVVFNQITNEFHQLTKIERQNDSNPLSFVHEALRNNLKKLNGGFERKTLLNDLGEGVIFIVNKREFRNTMLNRFKDDEFKKDTDYVKVIAWKNDTVIASNRIIRDELFGTDIDIVVENDVLMAYRSVSDEKQRYNVIENSADYRVIKKSKLEKNSYDIFGYRVKICENLPNGEFNYENIFIVDSNNDDNLHTYAEMHDFLKEKAIKDKKKWNDYYKFRFNNIIMITIDKYRNGQYRSSWETIKKDLDYGYAITSHKAQGSTYTHVFVLETDINDNMKLKERNQIKYVAFTRPSKTATVLTTKIDL